MGNQIMTIKPPPSRFSACIVPPWVATARVAIARPSPNPFSVVIRRDEHDDHWLLLLGKGGKLGKVALPSRARTALDQYLVQRGLPVTPTRWNPVAPLVASLDEDGAGIEPKRLWHVLRRLFMLVVDAIQDDRPVAAE